MPQLPTGGQSNTKFEHNYGACCSSLNIFAFEVLANEAAGVFMKIAYLILAHENPSHLHRLISALSDDDTEFAVHIDRKSNLTKFQSIGALPRTTLIPNRHLICWGGFSIVRATLDLMQFATGSSSFDRYCLLSGADYPIRSNETIRDTLTGSAAEFICCYPMPGPRNRKLLSRLETFRFEGALGPSRFRRVALHQTNRLFSTYKRNYKTVLGGMTPFAGSQWWCLTHNAVSYILRFVSENPGFVRFFRHSHIPDEMFFQTILGNSTFHSRITRNLTYADWSQGIQRHPAPLTKAHIDRFASANFQIDDEEGKGPCLFARKFAKANAQLIEHIDEWRSPTRPLVTRVETLDPSPHP